MTGANALRGQPYPTGVRALSVGVNLIARGINENADGLNEPIVSALFASRLAPTNVPATGGGVSPGPEKYS